MSERPADRMSRFRANLAVVLLLACIDMLVVVVIGIAQTRVGVDYGRVFRDPHNASRWWSNGQPVGVKLEIQVAFEDEPETASIDPLGKVRPIPLWSTSAGRPTIHRWGNARVWWLEEFGVGFPTALLTCRIEANPLSLRTRRVIDGALLPAWGAVVPMKVLVAPAVLDFMCYCALNAAAVSGVRRLRSWRRYARGKCCECGYPIRGLTVDTCPECGARWSVGGCPRRSA